MKFAGFFSDFPHFARNGPRLYRNKPKSLYLQLQVQMRKNNFYSGSLLIPQAKAVSVELKSDGR